jgi:uncharacterized protein
MASVTQDLFSKGLIKPPRFLPANMIYETMMGSAAYGVSTDHSDRDIYGVCIPPKNDIFPHLDGKIPGFGPPHEPFENFQQSHIRDGHANDSHAIEYDLSIYGIVRYFALCMEGNPNMLDSLFTAQDCVLHLTAVGTMIRENRRHFLHKGCWPKFKGYAYATMHKLRTKNPIGKRRELVEEFGFDVKYAYHIVRLLNECEQILTHADIDLRMNREQLKAIRRGEMTEQEVFAWASEKERFLEKLYQESSLPKGPDQTLLRDLLLRCLEEHYGKLENCVVIPEAADRALEAIQAILDQYRSP